MRSPRSRWLAELHSAESGTTPDRLSDLLAEAAHDGDASWPTAADADGPDSWAAALRLVVPDDADSGTGATWPAPASLRILRPGFASGPSAPPFSSMVCASEEIRHWLFARKDPAVALAAAERGWDLVHRQPGAAGWAACFASFGALAGTLLADPVVVELHLERADRARESAPDTFVASGADLGCGWARAIAAERPAGHAGDPRQREQASRSPLFAETASRLGERGIRLGFDERAPLSAHQERLLRLAGNGAGVRDLAARFGVSPRTIEGQLAAIRAALGATSLQSAIHVAGLRRTLPEKAGPSTGGRDALTPRERTVVELLSRGWRNTAIAHELGLSVRTVETHISHVMASSGTDSRVRLAAWWAARRGT